MTPAATFATLRPVRERPAPLLAHGPSQTSLMAHPGTPGCRCRQCWSLAEYMADLTGRDYGLQRAPGHASRGLRLVTRTDGCDGTMTCPCAKCAAERRSRVREGVRAVAQPWEPRRAA